MGLGSGDSKQGSQHRDLNHWWDTVSGKSFILLLRSKVDFNLLMIFIIYLAGIELAVATVGLNLADRKQESKQPTP